MAEPRLNVFPGGGRTTILETGAMGLPARLRVEFKHADAQQLREIQAFWESVHGPDDPWSFNLAGTIYEPCHFEKDSLKVEHGEPGYSITLTFRGLKIAGASEKRC